MSGKKRLRLAVIVLLVLIWGVWRIYHYLQQTPAAMLLSGEEPGWKRAYRSRTDPTVKAIPVLETDGELRINHLGFDKVDGVNVIRYSLTYEGECTCTHLSFNFEVYGADGSFCDLLPMYFDEVESGTTLCGSVPVPDRAARCMISGVEVVPSEYVVHIGERY